VVQPSPLNVGYRIHECCLLPTCCVGGALSAGCGAHACGARRRVMGTTRSYACATQAGLTQLGSNVMRTSRGGLPVRPRRATLASLYLWRRACMGQHALERCPQKPITIPRSQLCSWNARRKLYQHVGNFVGSVTIPPCGVPVRVACLSPCARTPARRNFQRRSRMSLSATRFLTALINLRCGIVSK